MPAKLIIAPEVEGDLLEAYSWYEDRRKGLGEEFLARVNACVRAICEYPESNTAVFQTFRRGLVARFPYAVFYEYERQTLTVYCVFHTAREPEKWKRRLS